MKQTREEKKKLILSKDKVSYSDKFNNNPITPVLSQTQRIGEMLRIKNISQNQVKKYTDATSGGIYSKQLSKISENEPKPK